MLSAASTAQAPISKCISQKPTRSLRGVTHPYHTYSPQYDLHRPTPRILAHLHPHGGNWARAPWDMRPHAPGRLAFGPAKSTMLPGAVVLVLVEHAGSGICSGLPAPQFCLCTLEYAAAHGPVSACRLSPLVGFEILPKFWCQILPPKFIVKFITIFSFFFVHFECQ